MNILLVLPYSGVNFGGRLAMLNEKLARALGKWHRVRLLTMKLRPPFAASADTPRPRRNRRDPRKRRPLQPRDFLVDVSPDAFEARPAAWSNEITYQADSGNVAELRP